jgi:hypothetical protein
VMDTVEHLLHKEGLDGMRGAGNSENCLEVTTFGRASGALRRLGTGFGVITALRAELFVRRCNGV